MSGLDEALDHEVELVRSGLVAWRHHLHAHPELSNREVNTAAFVAERLRELGLDEVRTGIAGHGVVGVLRGALPGERAAALRADMDALPDKEESAVGFATQVVDKDYPGGPFPVAHACGHDCQPPRSWRARGHSQRCGTGFRAPWCSCCSPRRRVRRSASPGVGSLPKGVVGYRVGNEYAASCLVKITIEGQQVHASGKHRIGLEETGLAGAPSVSPSPRGPCSSSQPASCSPRTRSCRLSKGPTT
jgi:hypothetical protein